MITFKQFFLAEDYQRGKTILFYHRTGLGGQSKSLENIKKETIEDHVDSFLKSGFIIGKGDRYGRGVYGFYTEESLLNSEESGYGDIVLKIKVNTDKILIAVKEVAKTVYGKSISLEEQFKTLNLKYDSEKMAELERLYDSDGNLGPVIIGYYGDEITRKTKGLVYKGGQDLGAMVVYDQKLLTIVSYNTTMKDSTKLDGPWINVLSKNKEQIKTALTQRLASLSTQEKPFDEIQFLMNLKQYAGKNYDRMAEKQRRKLDVRLIDYVKRDERAIKYIMSAGIKPSERVIAAAINAGWYDPPKEILDTLSKELKAKVKQNKSAKMKKGK